MGININFKPSKKQFQAWEYLMDNETLFVGYGGSAFSGKTYMLCYWLSSMCIAYPDTAWGLGRRELVNLKKTTLVTLFKVLAESGIENDKHYKYNQQENKITFFNGSVIYLIDTAYKPSDPLYTRFGGLELTGCAIDESAETDYTAIKILFTRLGRRNNNKYGLKKKLLETFNPAKNHVYSRYYKPHKEGKELPQHHFIPALPKDNPAPEVEDYIKDILATSDTVTIERLIKGNFEYDDDDRALMSYDAIINVFTNDFVEHGKKYISADIARYGKDTSIVVIWDGLRADKIKQYSQKSTLEMANIIKDLAREHKVPNTNIIVDEGGLGSGTVDNIPNCYGFVSNARALEGENYVNLKSQCYFKLADRINKSELYINLDGKLKDDLIQELEQVKQTEVDSDKKKAIISKDEVKEAIGRSPDISDAIMMRMAFDILPPPANIEGEWFKSFY